MGIEFNHLSAHMAIMAENSTEYTVPSETVIIPTFQMRTLRLRAIQLCS